MCLAKLALNEKDVRKHFKGLGDRSPRDVLDAYHTGVGDLNATERGKLRLLDDQLSPYVFGRPTKMHQAMNEKAEKLVTSGRHSAKDIFSIGDLPRTVTDSGKPIKGPFYNPRTTMWRGTESGREYGRWSSAHPEVAVDYAHPGIYRSTLLKYDRTAIPPSARGPWTPHTGIDPFNPRHIRDVYGVDTVSAMRRTAKFKENMRKRLDNLKDKGSSPTYETATAISKDLRSALVGRAKSLPHSRRFMRVYGNIL